MIELLKPRNPLAFFQRFIDEPDIPVSESHLQREDLELLYQLLGRTCRLYHRPLADEVAITINTCIVILEERIRTGAASTPELNPDI